MVEYYHEGIGCDAVPPRFLACGAIYYGMRNGACEEKKNKILHHPVLATYSHK
jgi:hypothetical protein